MPRKSAPAVEAVAAPAAAAPGPTPITEPKIIRDVRVDHVGFLDLLSDEFATPRRKEIKKCLDAKECDRVRADYFEGLLVTGEGTTVVSAASFYAMLKAGEISEEDFLGSISVRVGDAKKLMGEKRLLSISSKKPAGPALTIKPILEVPGSMSDALAAITKAIDG